jgi:hypothetical protein
LGNDAATGTAVFDLSNSKTLSGSTGMASLTFSPGNPGSPASGQSLDVKINGTDRDLLILILAGVAGASANGGMVSVCWTADASGLYLIGSEAGGPPIIVPRLPGSQDVDPSLSVVAA